MKWRSAQQAFRVCVRPCVCERGGGFIWKTLISFPTQLQWGGERAGSCEERSVPRLDSERAMAST